MSGEAKHSEFALTTVGFEGSGMTTLIIRMSSGRFEPNPNFDNYDAIYSIYRSLQGVDNTVRAWGLFHIILLSLSSPFSLQLYWANITIVLLCVTAKRS